MDRRDCLSEHSVDRESLNVCLELLLLAQTLGQAPRRQSTSHIPNFSASTRRLVDVGEDSQAVCPELLLQQQRKLVRIETR